MEEHYQSWAGFTKQKRRRPKGEREVNVSHRKVDFVPVLPQKNLRKVSPVGKLRKIPGELGKPPIFTEEELERLELAKVFATEFHLAPEDVRPCIALIYYQGVLTQREPYAFILALELHCLGLSASRIYEALEQYNNRLARRLLHSELRKFERKFTSQRYNKPYNCQKFELQPFFALV